MYKDLVKEKRTARYFFDAIKATTRTEENDSRYFKEGLSLVGVYLDSDFLSTSQVLAEPSLQVEDINSDNGITVTTRLKPENKEDPLLDILGLALEATNTGMFMKTEVLTETEKKELKEIQKLSTYILPKAITEDSATQDVTLFFNKDSVSLQKFKMIGQTYYLFSLTERDELDGKDYEHTLYTLFKDRDSSNETFFSSLVGYKLNRNVTRRVLESIAVKNITGMFLGGLTINTDSVRVATYAITNTGLSYTWDEVYVSTADSSLTIKTKDIEHSEVFVNEAGKYTFRLELKGSEEVYIYLG